MARLWWLCAALLGCTSASLSAVPEPQPTPKNQRVVLDDGPEVGVLFQRADACVRPHGGWVVGAGAPDGRVCNHRARTAVVLTVAPNGDVTDALVPYQGQLEEDELVCVAAAFRDARFVHLPRPRRFDVPIQVCW